MTEDTLNESERKTLNGAAVANAGWPDTLHAVVEAIVAARTAALARDRDALAAKVTRAKAEALEEAAAEADSIGHHWSGAPALAFFALASDLRDRAALAGPEDTARDTQRDDEGSGL